MNIKLILKGFMNNLNNLDLYTKKNVFDFIDSEALACLMSVDKQTKTALVEHLKLSETPGGKLSTLAGARFLFSRAEVGYKNFDKESSEIKKKILNCRRRISENKNKLDINSNMYYLFTSTLFTPITRRFTPITRRVTEGITRSLFIYTTIKVKQKIFKTFPCLKKYNLKIELFFKILFIFKRTILEENRKNDIRLDMNYLFKPLQWAICQLSNYLVKINERFFQTFLYLDGIVLREKEKKLLNECRILELKDRQLYFEKIGYNVDNLSVPRQNVELVKARIWNEKIANLFGEEEYLNLPIYCEFPHLIKPHNVTHPIMRAPSTRGEYLVIRFKLLIEDIDYSPPCFDGYNYQVISPGCGQSCMNSFCVRKGSHLPLCDLSKLIDEGKEDELFKQLKEIIENKGNERGIIT